MTRDLHDSTTLYLFTPTKNSSRFRLVSEKVDSMLWIDYQWKQKYSKMLATNSTVEFAWIFFSIRFLFLADTPSVSPAFIPTCNRGMLSFLVCLSCLMLADRSIAQRAAKVGTFGREPIWSWTNSSRKRSQVELTRMVTSHVSSIQAWI